MPITSTNTFSLSTIQRVIVDCAAMQRLPQAQQELRAIIGWIEGQVQRSCVHVTLRHATQNPTGRKLKSTFQALGCTVAMKTIM